MGWLGLYETETSLFSIGKVNTPSLCLSILYGTDVGWECTNKKDSLTDWEVKVQLK